MQNINLLKEQNIDVDTALTFWGDEASYLENLQEFNSSLKEKLTNLEYYKNTKDWTNYGVLAHSLKSEAKYLGFMNEAEVFLAHEQAGKNNDENYINGNFIYLTHTLNNISNILNNYFNNKKNILIADDSTIILNFLEKNISAEYTILKAQNGKEALENIQNNEIYAILLDLNMPSLNGFEVLEYLKNQNLLNSIPVVIITGDDEEETIKKAFSYPILDVLTKPFNENNINRILSSIKSFYNSNK